MTQQPRLELFRATWRPTLAWYLMLTVAVPLGLFVTVILGALAYGVVLAVTTGRPIPDITGGLDRLLQPAWPFIAAGIGGLFSLGLSRHNQNMAQARGGGLGQPPFEPSHTLGTPPEPSLTPEGGLVNTTGALDRQ